MAWNDDPKVRELGEYADRYGFEQAVVIGIKKASNTFELVSYGNNAARCKKARHLAAGVFQEIKNGQIEVL